MGSHTARAVNLAEAELLLIEPAGTPNTGDESTAAARVVI